MAGRIDWGYDAARLGAISFTLTETGGGGATGSVSLTGQYTHVAALGAVQSTDPQTGELESTDLGYVLLRTALTTALNAVGNATYTVSFDESALAYTITASGGSVTAFAISSLSTAAERVLGLTASSGALTYTGGAVWNHTQTEVGGFSEWTEAEVDAEAVDLFGADGSVRGLSPVGIARTLDFVAPWEPESRIWTPIASTDWTWARAFQRARTVEPIAVEDPTEDGAWVVGYLRADSCSLRPRLAASDYVAHQSIPIGMYQIGRVSGWAIEWADMAFSRSSEASYLTGSPTDGTSAFLAWASTDVLREENRGDGAGSLALLEGSRQNVVLRSQELDNASWTTAGSVTITAGLGGADGSNAERLVVASGTNIRYQSISFTAGPYALSTWARSTTGTISHFLIYYDGATVYDGPSATLSTTYQRLANSQTVGTGSGNIEIIDGRNVGSFSAGARDARLDLVQLEAGRFASSAIRTTSAAATRAADTLTMASGIPSALYSRRGQFAEFSPAFATSALASGDVFWLLSIGGSSNGIRVRHTGTDVRVEAVSGGSVVASSAAQTWSAHQVVGPIAWDPEAGRVYVNGTAGAAGTAWAWSAANIRVGGIYGGASEAFARLGRLESW